MCLLLAGVRLLWSRRAESGFGVFAAIKSHLEMTGNACGHSEPVVLQMNHDVVMSRWLIEDVITTAPFNKNAWLPHLECNHSLLKRTQLEKIFILCARQSKQVDEQAYFVPSSIWSLIKCADSYCICFLVAFLYIEATRGTFFPQFNNMEVGLETINCL